VFHLALIAYTQNRAADARPLVDKVLAAQLEHAGARALAARLETLVAKSDPLPPEDSKDVKASKDSKDASESTKDPKSPPGGATDARPDPAPPAGGGNYDALMKEADKVADTNCSRAIELYQKAREIKPDSAAALTGMGYCYIDAKQFASAHSMFRQALTFAKRYEPALYGVAEAYQQQGRKDDAINAYKAYLEVYPGAAKANRQLERLGVTPDGGGATTPAPPPPTPTPTPAPTPTTPTPAPAAAGSDTGAPSE
jgi:tetratricopeptide (TPR) repeat protein